MCVLDYDRVCNVVCKNLKPQSHEMLQPFRIVVYVSDPRRLKMNQLLQKV